MRARIGVGSALDGRVELARQWAFAFAFNSSLDCGVQFPGRAACAIGAGAGVVWVWVWVWVGDVALMCGRMCDRCARVRLGVGASLYVL